MRLIIIGAGGYGRTVADIALQSEQYDSVAFLDDNSTEEDVLNTCSAFEKYKDGNTVFYPAFGNNELRIEWIRRLEKTGCNIPVFVHSTAYVSPTAQVTAGTVIMPHAVVNTSCIIRQGCIVNCGAVIDHGCILEEGVHICPGAILKAENQIPACRKIEAGEVIQNRTYKIQKEKK